MLGDPLRPRGRRSSSRLARAPPADEPGERDVEPAGIRRQLRRAVEVARRGSSATSSRRARASISSSRAGSHVEESKPARAEQPLVGVGDEVVDALDVDRDAADRLRPVDEEPRARRPQRVEVGAPGRRQTAPRLTATSGRALVDAIRELLERQQAQLDTAPRSSGQPGEHRRVEVVLVEDDVVAGARPAGSPRRCPPRPSGGRTKRDLARLGADELGEERAARLAVLLPAAARAAPRASPRAPRSTASSVERGGSP